MSPAVVAGVGLLGGIGALARFLLDGAVSARVGRRFPWGTLVVNLSGALVLGFLIGRLSGDGQTLVATGLLGGYTTFSTWMFESHRLGEDGESRAAVVNLLGSLLLGILAVWLGRAL